MGDDSDVVHVGGCYISKLVLSDNIIIYDTGASVSIFKSMYGYKRRVLLKKNIVTGNGMISTTPNFWSGLCATESSCEHSFYV